MPGTPYESIFDSVISQIRDYAFADLNDLEIYDVLRDYLRPAIVRFHSCRSDLSDRDDGSSCFNFDLADQEIEILAKFILVEYIDANYIRVPTLLKSVLTSKDFQTYSPANHLAKMQSLREGFLEENRQLMRDYSYFDSELFVGKG